MKSESEEEGGLGWSAFPEKREREREREKSLRLRDNEQLSVGKLLFYYKYERIF